MARLLLALFAIGIVLLVLKRVSGMHRQRPMKRDANKNPRFEKTLQCARCGSYLPVSLTQETPSGPTCRDGCAAHTNKNPNAS